MGRAEASRAEDDTGALDELRFHWGSAYDIGAADGLYTARRRDGKGAPLTDHLPEGLRLRIQADYEAMPVPRDPAVNGAGRQRGMPDADEDQALDALALAWGDAYDIYVVDGQWRAWREGAGDEDVLTGSTPVTGRPHLLTGDAVPRWRAFEQLHPEVTIVPPGGPNDRWRAIVPLGMVPGRPDETTIGAWMLEGLMDQLDEIYPPDTGG